MQISDVVTPLLRLAVNNFEQPLFKMEYVSMIKTYRPGKLGWTLKGHHLQMTKLLRIMKLTVFILMAFCLHISAKTIGQQVTLSVKEAPLHIVLKSIKKQTNYTFFAKTDLLKKSNKVSLQLNNVTLLEALDTCFSNQPFMYSIEGRIITIEPKPSIEKTALHLLTDNLVLQVISGIVQNTEGSPLQGATISIKNSKKSVVTDANGRFTIQGNIGDILVVSYIGYSSKQIVITTENSKLILAELNVEVNDLDEAVVVAYGNTTQKRNIGALTVVKGTTIENLPNRSFDRSLQGQVPGLLVTTGTGQPGGGTSNIVLRGIGTGTNVTQGSSIRNPLFIIDGVQVTQDNIQNRTGNYDTPVSNPLAQINPSDIESITILKDASAIALYGSRASNGVILVITKQGKPGKPRINFRHQSDLAKRIKGQTEVMNQEQYLEWLYESYKNDNTGQWTDAKIKTDLISKFPVIVNAPGDTSFYKRPDWFSELYNDHAATFSNDISISGGSEFNTYYLNLEYTTQKGIVKKTGYDRASLRYNFTGTPARWINYGINSLFSYNKQNLASFYEDAAIVTGMPYAASPLLPIRLSNNHYQLLYKYGGPGPSNRELSNPAAALDFNSNRITSYRGLGNIFAEVNFLKNFRFRSNLGIDLLMANNKEKLDPRLTEYTLSLFTATGGRIEEKDLTKTTLISSNILYYNKYFGNKHSLNITLGQEAQIYNSKTLSAFGTGLTSPAYNQVSNATTTIGNGSSNKQTLLSYFAQANYSYNNKYLLSLSGRQDGSSKFGKHALYNNYWSAGAGWILSEEAFLKNTPWLNYAKFRGSIGVAGNSNSIDQNTGYDILLLKNYAGNSPAVLTNGIPANPLIKAEETLNRDLGIEGKLFNNRLGFTIDFYTRKISNLLYSIVLPGIAGGQSAMFNIGNMENKGTEISIQVDVVKNTRFRWSINANWSTNRNKLTKANTPLSQVVSYNLINKVGENFNSFFLVKWAGVDAATGNAQWLDSAGKITSNFSSAPRVIAGKPQPDAFGGINNTFTYKNLELQVFFYYQYGFQIYDKGLASLLTDGGENVYSNQSIKALNRWKNPGDQAENPRVALNNKANNAATARSTRYLFDGDFIRLKNVTLSYDLSQNLLKRLRINNLKVYFQANNLAIWTKYPGIDPETANPGGESAFAYPQPKTWSMGFNVGL